MRYLLSKFILSILMFVTFSFSMQQTKALGYFQENDIDRCGLTIRYERYKTDSVKVIITFGISWNINMLSSYQMQNGFVRLNFDYCIKDTLRNVIFEGNQRQLIDPFLNPNLKDQYHVDCMEFILPYGNFIINSSLKNIQTNDNLSKIHYFDPQRYFCDTLSILNTEILSSIKKIHNDIPQGSFVRGDYIVKTYPFHKIKKGMSPIIYFEIWNPQNTESAYSAYRIEYIIKKNHKNFFLLKKRKSGVGSEYLISSKNMRVQEFFAIDMSSMNCGLYQISIIVTELKSGVMAKSSVEIEIVK